jgi:oligopeptide transport system permease protein
MTEPAGIHRRPAGSEDPTLRTAEADAPVVGTSLWKDASRRLRKNRLAVLGFIVVCVVVVASAIGPWLIAHTTGYTYDFIPTDANLVNSLPPFSAPDGSFAWAHPMGTDDAGRDILARVLLGGRISLMVGVVSTLVSLVIGIAVGATAGYAGGRVDEAIMRFVDVLYSIPYSRWRASYAGR